MAVFFRQRDRVRARVSEREVLQRIEMQRKLYTDVVRQRIGHRVPHAISAVLYIHIYICILKQMF